MKLPRKSQAAVLRKQPSVREKIVRDAQRHFFTHGFRSVTMDDLADELGMSKKTLYAHFPSKIILLEAVLTDRLEKVGAELEKVTSGDLSDTRAVVLELVGCMQRLLQEVQPAFIRDMHRDAPEVFEFIRKRRREMVALHFKKIISEGRRRGKVRKDISVRWLMEILLGTVDSIINPHKLVELRTTPREALSIIMDLFFQGALTRSETK